MLTTCILNGKIGKKSKNNLTKGVKMEGKYVWTTKVSDKGQIVIPKEAREIFNINVGDTLLLLGDTEKGIAVVKAEQYLDFAEKILEANNKGEN